MLWASQVGTQTPCCVFAREIQDVGEQEHLCESPDCNGRWIVTCIGLRMAATSESTLQSSDLSLEVKNQHFRFDATHPGKVFAKLSIEPEGVKFAMLK